MYNECLKSMIGQVQDVKYNAQSEQIRVKINQRIRKVMDARIWWADMLAIGIISIPDGYSTGTITTAPGSNVLTGTATAWPVSDAANTAIQKDVFEVGVVDIPVSNMAGITVGGSVYIADTNNPAESVPVIRAYATSFKTRVRYEHAAGTPVYKSSLAGLQFRAGVQYPIFTVLSVVSPTSLIIDMPWGGPALVASPYSIYKMYDGIDPDCKYVLMAVDQQQGIPLTTGRNSTSIDLSDPQRTDSGDPIAILNHSVSEGGVWRYEIYPAPNTARQIQVCFTKQWPELLLDSDVPPWFINPKIFVDGACADILRTKAPNRQDMKPDPYHNPKLAMEFETQFALGAIDAVNADEAKALRAYETLADQMYPGGANFWRNHDQDLMAGRF